MPAKSRKRGNGEGSISKRKDGSWISQITVGIKEDGKPIRKTFYGKTRQEVATKLIPYLNGEMGKSHIAKEDVRIKEHMLFWMMNYKILTVSPRTFESAMQKMNLYIIPQFGDLKPQQITIDLLQQFFKELLDKYQTDTVKKVKYLLSGYMEYCIERGLISVNPVSRIKFKSTDRKAKEIGDGKDTKAMPEELREPFLRALNNDKLFKPFCMTSMFAGLRPAEVIGLKWRDLDFDNRTISVMRASTVETTFDDNGKVVSRKTVIGKTKTAGSVRTNPMPALLADALIEWREYRQGEQERTGAPLVGENDFVFGTNNGELRTYYGITHMFNKFLKKNGLDGKGIHFYELRHTFSNTLFENNTNPRIVQALMGHKKIETTMIYNTVRDNKYLEEAVSVFDKRYESALANGDDQKSPSDSDTADPSSALSEYLKNHGPEELAKLLTNLNA